MDRKKQELLDNTYEIVDNAKEEVAPDDLDFESQTPDGLELTNRSIANKSFGYVIAHYFDDETIKMIDSIAECLHHGFELRSQLLEELENTGRTELLKELKNNS